MDSDLKSHLSIIANSATVVVWVIDQDVLALLPFEVQMKIVDRLRSEQKVVSGGDELNKRPKEAELRRIQDEKERQ